MPDFLLPDLGEGLQEAEVTAWYVRVGDQVAVDQIVAEVETAKAAVEVPIPFAGTVTALHAETGTTVPVGAPLISVAAAAPDGGWPGPQPAAAPDDGRPEPQAADEASGNVLVGYGTRPSPRRARGPRRSAVSATGRPLGPMLAAPLCPLSARRRLAAGSRRSPRADARRPGAGHLTDRAQARPPGRA